MLDHLVITAPALEDGVELVENTLGVEMDEGGHHVAMGTHNRLMSLGPSDYLEVIAVNPRASAPGRSRFFDLDAPRERAGLTNWVLRVENLCDARAKAPAGVGDGVAMARGPHAWTMAVPEMGQQPFDGLFPNLIQWSTTQPAAFMTDTGIRLEKLTLTHPDAEGLSRALHDIGFTDGRVVIEQGAVAMRALLRSPAGDYILA